MIPFTVARYYASDQGIQEKMTVLTIKPNQLQQALNVHFYENGAWTKRNGYIKRTSADLTGTPIVTGLFQFIKRDGTTYFITAADKLYSSAQGDAAQVVLTGSPTFTVGTNGENFMSMLNFDNKTIGSNGVEVMWQFDGTTVSTLAGSPPLATMLANFNSFIFAAGNATYPYRLYFCNDGNETVWSGTDYIDIGDLTSPITGLAVLFNNLYIFTRKQIYQLSGYSRDTFSVSLANPTIGCVAWKSIVQVDNNLIFFSERGIYSFDGVNVHYLSEGIQLTVSKLNYSRIGQVIGGLYRAKDQVWFSVSTGSNATHNEVICMTFKPTISESSYGISNVLYGQTTSSVAFAVYTNMSINAFGLERGSGPDALYSGNYAGRVHLQDFGSNDDGAGINFFVKLPPIDCGSPEDFKRFRYMWLFNASEGAYSVTVGYISDFGTGGTTVSVSLVGGGSLWGSMVWGTDTWGGGQSIIHQRVNLNAKGRHLEITFQNSNADQPIVIKGFSILAQNKGASHR